MYVLSALYGYNIGNVLVSIDGDVTGDIIGGVTSSVTGIVNVGEYLETQQLSAVSNNQQLPMSVSHFIYPIFLQSISHFEASNLYFIWG